MKKTTGQRILRILVIAFIAIFLISNFYLLNEKTLRGNALPMPFGCGTAIVLSGSMEPAFCVDDMIIVVRSESYETGDVVVFQSGMSLVVHRIVAIEGNMVTTQGDANNTPDAPVEASLVKGKVVGCVRNVGRIVRLLKSPVVAFGLMALAIYLLESSFRKEKGQDHNEIQKLEEEIRRLKEAQEE
ncbi:MAG: signal peptidase I [Oscillospiraceae bacterium]|nr:signal peptidase I [Oscillospiraceae bacterium]